MDTGRTGATPLHNGPERPSYARFPAPYRPSSSRPDSQGAGSRPSGVPGRVAGYLTPSDRRNVDRDLGAVPGRYPGPNRELIPGLDEVRNSLERLSDRQRYGRGPIERLTRPPLGTRPVIAERPSESRTPSTALERRERRDRLAAGSVSARPESTVASPIGRRRGEEALRQLRREQETNPARAETIRQQSLRLANLRAEQMALGTTLAAGPVAGDLVRRRFGGQGLLPGGAAPGAVDGPPDASLPIGETLYPYGSGYGYGYGGGYFQPSWNFGFGWGCGALGWPFGFGFGSSWFWWNYYNHPCFGPFSNYWGFGGGFGGGFYGGFSPWYWWTPYPFYSWAWSAPLYYGALLQTTTQQPAVVIVEQSQPQTVVIEQPAPASPAAPAAVMTPSPLQTNSPPAAAPMGPAGERYLTLGDRAFRDGRYGDAAHYYGKAVEAQPDSGVLHLVLADALFATGDYSFAATAIRRGLELDPDLVWSTIDKRSFYRNPTDFDAQLAVLELYLLDHPEDRDAKLVLALNYLFGNAPARAVDFLASVSRGDAAFDTIRKAAEELQFGRAAEVK